MMRACTPFLLTLHHPGGSGGASPAILFTCIIERPFHLTSIILFIFTLQGSPNASRYLANQCLRPKPTVFLPFRPVLFPPLHPPPPVSEYG